MSLVSNELLFLREAMCTSLASMTSLWREGDRRGNNVYRYIPDPSSRDVDRYFEITLEYEWFHKVDGDICDRFKSSLIKADGKTVGDALLSSAGMFSDLIVKHVPRNTKPQSLDQYYDTDKSDISRADATVRERLTGSEFMTWGSGSINIELPYVRPVSGLGARIEFNLRPERKGLPHYASLSQSQDKSVDALKTNPFFWLAEAIPGIVLADLRPIVRLSKQRSKFHLLDPDNNNEKFLALNLDTVSVTNLSGEIIGTYTDCEIAVEGLVDEAALHKSHKFVDLLRNQHGLVPLDTTRMQRALSVIE